LQATIQEQIVDEEWQEPQQIEESYCFPAEMSSVCHPELAEGNCPPWPWSCFRSTRHASAHSCKVAVSQC